MRRYPVSGYSDNALLQGAGLFKLAFDRYGDATDRRNAERLLTWLKKQYPSSSLMKEATTRLAQLAPAPAAPAPRATLDPPATTTKPAVTPTPPASPPPAPPVTPPAAPKTPPAITKAPPVVAANAPKPVAPAPVVETAAVKTPATSEPPPAVTVPANAPASTIRTITHTPLPRGDRLIVELTQEAAYAGVRVEAPDRVFFDFANAVPATDVVQRAGGLAGTFVKAVRVGRPSSSITRVMVELGGASRPRYSAFPLYNPFRLVIDVESSEPPPPPPTVVTVRTEPDVAAPPAPAATTGTSAATASTPPAPPPTPPRRPRAAATSRGDYSLARQLGLSVSRVVIDPGHGGHDPGAQANGINEAELVLDIAQRVAKLLGQKPGFEVVLTRSTDEFIPLEERTAIAKREEADLFLSIHANASRNTAARGIETYILNFATNPDAEAVAARENATSAQTMGALPSILKAIAANNKRDESRELATILQTGARPASAHDERRRSRSRRETGAVRRPHRRGHAERPRRDLVPDQQSRSGTAQEGDVSPADRPGDLRRDREVPGVAEEGNGLARQAGRGRTVAPLVVISVVIRRVPRTQIPAVIQSPPLALPSRHPFPSSACTCRKRARPSGRR